MEDNNYVFIVDKYNKYQRNANVIRTFNLFIGGNAVPYCIRKIPIEYDWGIPSLTYWEEQDFEEDYSYQHFYATEEEAYRYVLQLKGEIK